MLLGWKKFVGYCLSGLITILTAFNQNSPFFHLKIYTMFQFLTHNNACSFIIAGMPNKGSKRKSREIPTNASRSTVRKSRKVSATSTEQLPETSSSGNQPSNIMSDDTLNSQVQSVVTALIPQLIPAITQGVITSLTSMGVVPGISNATQQQPSTSTTVSNVTSSEQQTLNEAPGSAVISTCNSNVSAIASGSEDSHVSSLGGSRAVSMARPLDLGIDPKIKGKIWANQFIDLNVLLPNNRQEKIELVDNGDGVLTFKKSNSGKIRTIDRWLEAFHIFVAIYASSYPNDTPDLMRHATIVQRLSKQAGDEAALFYDENFRLWRQDNPNGLPWGSISSELQNEALAMGFSKKQNHSFQGKTKQIPKKPCFRFNNSNGQCQRTNCPYDHKCQKCGGPHGKKLCTRNIQNNDFKTNRGPKRTGQSAPASRT